MSETRYTCNDKAFVLIRVIYALGYGIMLRDTEMWLEVRNRAWWNTEDPPGHSNVYLGTL